MKPRNEETDRESILRLLRDRGCEPTEGEGGEIHFFCHGLALTLALGEASGDVHTVRTTLRQGREDDLSTDARYYIHRRSLLGSVARFNDLPGRRVRAGVHRNDKHTVTVGTGCEARTFDRHFDSICQALLDAGREIEEVYLELVGENS